MKTRQFTLADWKPTARQLKLVEQTLKSGRLTYGPMHKEFEEKFAKLHDRKYAIFTNSGTSALQVALHFLKEEYGWKDGDEVIVPAVTFVATVNVVLQNNLTPVLVDVDPEHFDIDVEKIEDALTERTRAIIPVHLLGQPCQIEKVMKIAKEFDLKVIEDSAESMFVKRNGKPVGSQGDIACFSSYLAHIISTGVGGFITTNNKEWADAMRSMIWHGRDNYYLSIDDNAKNKEKLLHSRFKFNRIGYSYRLTELEAAIGIDELDRSEKIIRKRQENGEYLTKTLKPFESVLQLPKVRKGSEHAWMFYPLVVRTPGTRDKLCLFLEERGVQTRYLMPLTNQPVYKELFDERDYMVADHINKQGLLLGCHHYLKEKDLDYLVSMIGDFYDL